MDKTNVTFTFTKKKEPATKIQPRNVDLDTDHNQQDDKDKLDFVTSIDDKEIKTTIKSEESHTKSELVIPLIQNNNWRRKKVKQEAPDAKREDHSDGNVGDTIEDKARQELVTDAKRHLDEWEERGSKQSTRVIPVFVANKAPDGYEEDDHFDVSARAENPTQEDYEKVPVEEFGMAMLRGMGFKPEDAKILPPAEVKIRPKGLGLGADVPSTKPSAGTSSKEILELKKGGTVLVAAGKHKGLYGTVESFDEDMIQANVHLVLPNLTESVPVAFLNVVSREEFKKESKVLNKNSYDEYRKKDDHKHRSSREKRSRSRDRRSRSREHDRHRRESHGHDRERNGHRKSTDNQLWLTEGLRMRIIDRHFKSGRFYREKVEIIDIPRPGICSVMTADRKRLDDVSHRMLETVIPKEDQSMIMIVRGDNHLQKGLLVSRDKKRSEVVVQLVNDPTNLMTLSFDDICELSGSYE